MTISSHPLFSSANLSSEASVGPTADPSASQRADPSAARESDFAPKFALRSDGAVLLVLDDFLKERDLGGRAVWTGVVLLPHEVATVMERLANAEHDAAAQLAPTFPKLER
jgi:hypothetical protein